MMNHNSKKFVLGTIFTLFLLFLPTTSAYPVEEAFTILQSPSEDTLVVNHSLNVTVINNQLNNISSINLFYCSLEPEFVCHSLPIELVKNDQGNFFTVFMPEYEINTILGYHLKVNMANGSDFEVPNSLDYTSGCNIQQGPDSNYYFELTLIGGSSSENTTPWISIEGILTIVLGLSIIKRIKTKSKPI